jgi:hypothetical protein
MKIVCSPRQLFLITLLTAMIGLLLGLVLASLAAETSNRPPPPPASTRVTTQNTALGAIND